MYNEYQINKQRMASKQETDHLINKIQKKYNIFDFKERRNRIKRKSKSRKGYITSKEYSPEIFTQYWNKFKSMFGHVKRELDNDDLISIY